MHGWEVWARTRCQCAHGPETFLIRTPTQIAHAHMSLETSTREDLVICSSSLKPDSGQRSSAVRPSSPAGAPCPSSILPAFAPAIVCSGRRGKAEWCSIDMLQTTSAQIPGLHHLRQTTSGSKVP